MAYVIEGKASTTRPARLPHYAQLKNGTEAEMDIAEETDNEQMRAILNSIIREGNTYPQTQELDAAGFKAYYISHDAFVVRDRKTKQVLGAVYIKPNFPGRCNHICNGGFIVADDARGLGVGQLLAELYIPLARDLGYKASFFNLVFVDNGPSVHLWRKFGFKEIGIVPNARRKDDGTYVDAIQFYYDLTK